MKRSTLVTSGTSSTHLGCYLHWVYWMRRAIGGALLMGAGVASEPSATKPVLAPNAASATAIDDGGYHRCLLDHSGRVACWVTARLESSDTASLCGEILRVTTAIHRSRSSAFEQSHVTASALPPDPRGDYRVSARDRGLQLRLRAIKRTHSLSTEKDLEGRHQAARRRSPWRVHCRSRMRGASTTRSVSTVGRPQPPGRVTRQGLRRAKKAS